MEDKEHKVIKLQVKEDREDAAKLPLVTFSYQSKTRRLGRKVSQAPERTTYKLMEMTGHLC